MSIKIDKGRQLKEDEIDKIVLGYNYQIKDKIFKKCQPFLGCLF